MSDAQPNIEQIRSKAREIAERARNDASFMEHLRNDPEQVLREAGLHESAISDFIREGGLGPEVSGYMLEELDRLCQNTCIVTNECVVSVT